VEEESLLNGLSAVLEDQRQNLRPMIRPMIHIRHQEFPRRRL
jgi:hypothetical protein